MHTSHKRPRHGDRAHLNGQHRLDVPLRVLSCAETAGQIGALLERLPGVTLAEIDPATKRATILFDPTQCDPDQITHALETNRSAREVGAFVTWQFDVGDGTGPEPWRGHELTLETIIGVREATVDPRTATLTVRYAPGLTDVAAMRRLVNQHILA
jgi:copper chaperone CopZ